jgi:hypothetical protein
LKFPRFYFLSDDDLLEILGQANKPEIVQSHLRKLFAGINSVIFEQSNIVSVRAFEGETVRLKNPVTISLDVEVRLYFIIEIVLEKRHGIRIRIPSIGSVTIYRVFNDRKRILKKMLAKEICRLQKFGPTLLYELRTRVDASSNE